MSPDSVKYAFRRYSAEERAELRRTPALIGTRGRALVLSARNRLQAAAELPAAAPAPAPVLRR